jgi:hypothetical protein
MRQLVLVVVLAVVLGFSPALAQAPAWEYATFAVRVTPGGYMQFSWISPGERHVRLANLGTLLSTIGARGVDEDLLGVLAFAGSRGWELVLSYEDRGAGETHFIFKRPAE